MMKLFEQLNDDILNIPLDDLEKLINNNSEDDSTEEYDDLIDYQDNDSVDDIENFDNFEDEESESNIDNEDDNYQGVIRNVKGAYLVYKKRESDDSFTELWVMNVGRDMKRDFQIRRAILSGTDIDPKSQVSDDEHQQLESYSIGNVQFLKITGLEQ